MRFLIFSLLFSSCVNAHPFQHEGTGIALTGYDPVSYFEISPNKDPKKGKSNFQHKWGGVTWHFATNENMQKFIQNPKKYAPLYQGYCAYAAANNYVYQGDPLAWTVFKGKLYLNANKSVRSDWLENKVNYIKQANKNWPSLQPK